MLSSGLFNSNYQQHKDKLTAAISFLESKINELVAYQENEDDSREQLNVVIIFLVAGLLGCILLVLGWYRFHKKKE